MDLLPFDGNMTSLPCKRMSAGALLWNGADRVVLSRGTLVDAPNAGTSLGAASGLKMAFASLQKASRPLVAVAHALARTVDETLGLLSADTEVTGRQPGPGFGADG